MMRAQAPFRSCAWTDASGLAAAGPGGVYEVWIQEPNRRQLVSIQFSTLGTGLNLAGTMQWSRRLTPRLQIADSAPFAVGSTRAATARRLVSSVRADRRSWEWPLGNLAV